MHACDVCTRYEPALKQWEGGLESTRNVRQGIPGMGVLALLQWWVSSLPLSGLTAAVQNTALEVSSCQMRHTDRSATCEGETSLRLQRRIVISF